MISSNKKSALIQNYREAVTRDRRSLGSRDGYSCVHRGKLNTQTQRHVFKQQSQQISDGKQNIAKDVLIEIGQSQFNDNNQSLIKCQTKNLHINSEMLINSWFSPEKKHRKSLMAASHYPRSSLNKVYNRNSRSAAGTPSRQRVVQNNLEQIHNQLFNSNNFNNTNNSNNANMLTNQRNTIQRLKQALKKLESPQKKSHINSSAYTSTYRKQNRTEILQNIIQKRRNSNTRVSDLIKLKQCSNQLISNTMNTSTLKNIGQLARNNRISTANIKTNNQHKICRKYSRIIPCFPTQPLQLQGNDQLFNIKEARKNRTLRNILQ